MRQSALQVLVVRAAGSALLALGLLADLSCGGPAKTAQGPTQVLVTGVVQRDVPVVVEWVGTLNGDVNADIRPKVEGYILRQLYQEGSIVRKGQPLFQIDPRQFKASLDQALGNLERYRAALDQANIDVARYTPLAKEKAVSQQELDNALSEQRSAQANVASAQAAVDNAKLNLDWCTVSSPIDGIAGIAQFQVGALVNGQTVLTTVSTVDPIQVLFQISEQQYLWSAEALKGKTADTGRMELELVLSDGSTYPHKGRPIVADRAVNVKTGTIAVKGIFPNPGNLLRPGQFAKVRAAVRTVKGALLVPQRAVTELQGGYQVAVVRPDNTVDIRTVKTGPQVGSLWVIEEGLKPGERVVAEGVQKVKAGAPVAAKPVPPEGAKEPEAPAAAGR